MSRALILGGTGLIGGAVARRLVADGWQVDVTGRNPAKAINGADFHAVDRHGHLSDLLGDGADLLVDCLCYTAEHARELLPLTTACAGTVMISSKGVYVDDRGNHSNSDEHPRFDGPISESQPTVPAGGGDYRSREGYGRNKVAAEQVLLDSGQPVTVLRPSKVHGRSAERPREWVFAKRALDRRQAILLAHGGAGVDHTSAASNVASLVACVAEQPGARILNAADPDAPTGLEIARAVARTLDHAWEEVLLGDDAPSELGTHPWDAAYPIVLDLTAGYALGWRPAGTFAETVVPAVEWLASVAVGGPGGVALPDHLDRDFFEGAFDYAAEDAWLADRS